MIKALAQSTLDSDYNNKSLHVRSVILDFGLGLLQHIFTVKRFVYLFAYVYFCMSNNKNWSHRMYFLNNVQVNVNKEYNISKRPITYNL